MRIYRVLCTVAFAFVLSACGKGHYTAWEDCQLDKNIQIIKDYIKQQTNFNG